MVSCSQPLHSKRLSTSIEPKSATLRPPIDWFSMMKHKTCWLGLTLCISQHLSQTAPHKLRRMQAHKRAARPQWFHLGDVSPQGAMRSSLGSIRCPMPKVNELFPAHGAMQCGDCVWQRGAGLFGEYLCGPGFSMRRCRSGAPLLPPLQIAFCRERHTSSASVPNCDFPQSTLRVTRGYFI